MVSDLATWSAAILALGMVLAGGFDLRWREVPGPIWFGLAGIGVVVGLLELPSNAPPTAGALWALVGAVAVAHLVDWERPVEARWVNGPVVIDLVLYVSSLVAIGSVVAVDGWGSPDVPPAVVVVLGIVLLARLLFELRILWGGADVKALIVVGLLLPLFPTPWIPLPSAAQVPLAVIPFAITALSNAALCAVVVPLAFAVRNLSRGEWRGLRSFRSFAIATEELPHRFVWAEELPAGTGYDPGEPETAAEDRSMREALRRELSARRIDRVRVTPQVPMVALLAVGVVLGLAVGNLVIDLAAVL